MAFKIFYSWQSTTDNKYNWYFIGDCLKDVLKKLRDTYGEEAEFYIDRDTKDLPGFVDIPTSVFDKIENCDVFIGDLTVVGHLENGQGITNQNVFGELNYALAKLGEERIVNVMNIYHGDPKKENIIPFDLDHRRFPIPYSLSNENISEKADVKKKLVNDLFGAIRTIYETEHERQKKEFFPFETWKTWDESSPKKFNYEVNEYILKQFNSIRENVKSKGSITRILGLSGLGKTKLLLECFRQNGAEVSPELCNSVLYVNLNEYETSQVIGTIKSLYRNRSRKIVILDNCSLQQHENVKSTFQNESCQLSLITISPEPNEDRREIDPEGKTLILKFESREFRPIVRQLLEKNFPELTPGDVELFVDYSNGLPLFAVLMGNHREDARLKPGTLTSHNILEKLLGNLYSDPQNKKVILACTVFSRFGFFDELETQGIAIAQSREICTIDETDPERRLRRFKDVCEKMQQRDLLEKIGYSYSFRPTPLALKLAEEWWEDCTTDQFQKIIPFLREYRLVERFCEQFRLLTHIEHAKEIVGNLCEGVFSTAEVLNTEVGSRLFRSFVNVNPIACSNAIDKAFSKSTINSLKQVSAGRRNLVWALEQLCFREETFSQSVKILASFAVSENENIGNNATGQFLQLFHIHLPATSVNLQERWQIIVYCFNKGSAFRHLGIDAAIRALKTDSFTRMVGAEENYGNQRLVDYQPNFKEINSYWSNVTELLFEVATSESQEKTIAVNTLLDRTFGICEHGHGDLIIPKIEKLYDLGLIPWQELRSTFQHLVGHNRIRDKETITIVKDILDHIVPDSFEARFEIFVKEPSRSDYYGKYDDDGRDKSVISKKVDEVSDEFVKQPQNWNERIQLFTSGVIVEGANFGQAIGNRISSKEQQDLFIQLYLDQLEKVDKDHRNLGILIGFLHTQTDDSQVLRFFDFLYSKNELSYLLFLVAKQFELPYEYIMKLFTLVENNNAQSIDFSNFYYGWGLKHLNETQFIEVLKKISDIDSNGKLVAFSIITTTTYNDKELWSKLMPFTKDLLFNHGEIILEKVEKSTDYYLWSETVLKLLKGNRDEPFAARIIDIIIMNSNKTEGYFSTRDSFLGLLYILADHYFKLLWSKLSKVILDFENYATASYHLRDLLAPKNDYMVQTEGVLFKSVNNFNTVLEWCREHTGDSLYWIAGVIPIYDLKAESKPMWHPFMLKFLEEFGDNETILHEISAKLSSYSWVGSIVPRLENQKELFQIMTNFPNDKVASWAKANIQYLEKDIENEKNRDAEGF